METDDYRRFEMEKDGMQIVLEFPVQPEDEAFIKNEIDPILTGILKEYFSQMLYEKRGQ